MKIIAQIKWVPLLASPFILGILIQIFPLNDTKIVLIGVTLLSLFGLLGLVIPFLNRPFTAGILFLLFILSSPFWGLKREKSANILPDQLTYSFQDSQKNPAAFVKWWNFFVEEVVRTNKIIFKLDPTGKADSQGIQPFIPIPNAAANFYKGRIVINNQGYRGDNFPREKGNIYRIITIGDSTTFGQSLFPESAPWSELLQQLIANNLKCERPIQVVNGGVNGHHLQNGIERIERDHQWLKPDMVLSYFGWNSMADLGVYPALAAPPTLPATEHHKKIDILKWYIEKAWSSFLNEETAKLKIILTLGKVDSNKKLLKIAKSGQLFQEYQHLLAQSRRLNYQLILLSFNTAITSESAEESKKFYEISWPGVRAIVKQVEIHNEMIKEFTEKHKNILFFDTSNALLGKYDEEKFLDVVHFTPRGEHIMAENVFKQIRPVLLRNKQLNCKNL